MANKRTAESGSSVLGEFIYTPVSTESKAISINASQSSYSTSGAQLTIDRLLVSYLMVCPKHSTYTNLVRTFLNTQAELLLDILNGTNWAEGVLLRGWPDADVP